MPTRAFLLLLLLIMEIGMLLMAALYLSGRRGLGWLDYLAWGLLALVLPVLGPFLVIVFRPGESRGKLVEEHQPAGSARRLRMDDPSVTSR